MFLYFLFMIVIAVTYPLIGCNSLVNSSTTVHKLDDVLPAEDESGKSTISENGVSIGSKMQISNPRDTIHGKFGHQFIDPDKFDIIMRGTSRAPVMDMMESDIPFLQNLLHAHIGKPKLDNFQDHLAVMILFAFQLEMPINLQMHRRLLYLRCSLSKLYQNVGRYTPIHVYVWVQESSMIYIPDWINEMFPEVIILSIPQSSWTLPTDSGDPKKWNFGNFGEDYFLMGRWRLTFAMSFVKKMGYEYMLQMDDDTFFMEPIPFNIIERFRQENYVWGVRNRRFIEIPHITNGLPEIANYWMRSRNVSEPFGELYKFLSPPSIEGLTSIGWNRVHYSGCFQLINVHFWHEEVVQNFVQMVVKLGADMEQRWQEQAIQNMVRLLFVPAENLHIFDSFILHGKPSPENIEQIGCKNISPYQEDEDRVAFLVYIKGDNMLELLNYDWECKFYEAGFGPCDVDRESILQRHLVPYTKLFINHFKLNASWEEPLLNQATQQWNALMEKSTLIESKEPHHDHELP